VLSSPIIRAGDEEGDRIVGGDEVEAHSIPWQVGLMHKDGNFLFCGGTIVSSTKILTAAQCNIYELDSTYVIVGEHSLLSSEDGVKHNMTSFVSHPDYDAGISDNDFAVITLERPIDLGDKAVAACLPQSEDNPPLAPGTSLTVSGWGGLAATGQFIPNDLHSANVSYISNEECQKAYEAYEHNPVTANMMCAGNIDELGIDSCQGDSGGPLTVQNTVVGVVSWGIGCSAWDGWNGKYPGVYARVTKQLQWIKDQGVINACGDEANPDGPKPENSNLSCNLDWVGDGVCDARNNHKGCFFDGNDCCDEYADSQFCNSKVKGCRCKKNAFKKCEYEDFVNDGACDPENNNAKCNYDGGDCCTRRGSNSHLWDDFCGNNCVCILPKSKS